tara:strand:+ start:207 stop:1085 length:879 start_codon:yes stop_codon:yes gene_type:complete
MEGIGKVVKDAILKQNQQKQTIQMGYHDPIYDKLRTQRGLMANQDPRRTMRSHSISPPLPPTVTRNTRRNVRGSRAIPIDTKNITQAGDVCFSDPLIYRNNGYLTNGGSSSFFLPYRIRGGGKRRKKRISKTKKPTKKSIKKNKKRTRKSRNNNNSGYNASNSSITTFISDKSNTNRNSATEIYQELQSRKRSIPPIRSGVLFTPIEMLTMYANTKPKNNSNNSSNCSSLTESSNGNEVPEHTVPSLPDLANASQLRSIINVRKAEIDAGHRHREYFAPYRFNMNHSPYKLY